MKKEQRGPGGSAQAMISRDWRGVTQALLAFVLACTMSFPNVQAFASTGDSQEESAANTGTQGGSDSSVGVGTGTSEGDGASIASDGLGAGDGVSGAMGGMNGAVEDGAASGTDTSGSVVGAVLAAAAGLASQDFADNMAGSSDPSASTALANGESGRSQDGVAPLSLGDATLITSSVTSISAGGTYEIDSSVADEHVVTISTTDEVTITTNGEEAQSGIVFEYSVDGGSLTLLDAKIKRSATATSSRANIKFKGGDNTFQVSGDNSLVCVGQKLRGDRTKAGIVEVPEGCVVTFMGDGYLHAEYTGDNCWGYVIGSGTGTIAGTVNFGLEGATVGPQMDIVNSCGSTAAGIGSIASGKGLIDGTASAVNFNCGRFNVYSPQYIITAAHSDSSKFSIKVGSNATVNIAGASRWKASTSPYHGPVSVGFHDGTNRVEQGSFVVEPGAIVRCYAASTAEGMFDEGYDSRMVFMNMVNAADPVGGLALYTVDVTGFSTDSAGRVAYVVDGNTYYYYPAMQGGSSKMPEGSENQLPLYLTKASHQLEVNGKKYQLTWDGEAGSFSSKEILQTSLITADVTDISAGGAYEIDGSVTSEHVVTISTTDKVTVTTNGEEVQSGIVFKYVVDDGDFVFSDAKITRNAPATVTQASVHFQGGDNNFAVDGDNSLVCIGNKQGRDRTKAGIVEVPYGSSLTFTGEGSLRLEGSGSFYSGMVLGMPQATMPGTINFGEKDSAVGPRITVVAPGNTTSVAVGSMAQGSNLIDNGLATSLNFNSGRVDISAGAFCIALPAKNVDNFSIYVARNATVNIAEGTYWGIFRSPYHAPVGVGFHDGVSRILNGSFFIEPGAIVRCYAASAAEGIFDKGYDARIVFMNLYAAAVQRQATPVVGYTLDATDALGAASGPVSYSIDGAEYTYDPTTQAGSSAMSDVSGYMLPLFLTPEDHTVVVNGKEYPLLWDGVSFSTDIPAFALSYDYGIGEDFLYTAPSSVSKTEFTGNESAFKLEEPMLEGYTFKGWFTYETADDGSVVLGEQVENIDPSQPESRADFNLIAQWEPIMLEVPYDHWEGGTSYEPLQYGKDVIVDGIVVDDELTSADIEGGFKVSCPEGISPEEGFTSVGYQVSRDSDGNLVFTLRSGMPAMCRVTIAQPEKGCEIWAVDQATNERYVANEDGVIGVPNGTTIGLRAYPEDGFEFEAFTIDGEVLANAEGKPLYQYTVKEHVEFSAQIRMVTFIRASIPADEGAVLIDDNDNPDDDVNVGLRKATNGIQYRIVKTGIRYVGGEVQYVKDYPVYDGDPLYEGDVLSCTGAIDSSVVPADVDMEYVGNVRFSFNGDDLQESQATYKVTGKEEGSGSASELEAQVGNLTISPVLPRYTQKTWLNIADTSWYAADEGTLYISTPEQLAGIIKLMGEGNHFTGQTVVLTDDISLKNNDGTDGKRLWDWCADDFMNSTPSFDGMLDGDGHVVSGMQVEFERKGETYYASLLGYVKGTVKNLTVEGSVGPKTSNDFMGNFYAAGIAGCLDGGTIENCTARVEVQGYSYNGGIVGYVKDGVIKGCLNEGNIYSKSNNTGGIVGRVAAKGKVTVEDCINTGSITGAGTMGGIAGSLYGNTQVLSDINFVNCVNHGLVGWSNGVPVSGSTIGGILGYGDATFTGCINTGTVQVMGGTSGPNLGGIIGWAGNPVIIECANTGTVRAIVANDEAMHYVRVGGLVGYLNATKTGAFIKSSYSTGEIDAGYAVDYNTEDGNYTCAESFSYVSGIGGLVGSTSWVSSGAFVSIENCYVAGSLNWNHKSLIASCMACNEKYVPGGLVGAINKGAVYLNARGDSEDAGLFISNSYFSSDVAKDTMGLTTVRAIGRQPYQGSGSGLSESDNSSGLGHDDLVNAVLGCTDENGNLIYQEYEGETNGDMPILSSQELVAVAVHDSVGEVITTLGCQRGFFITADQINAAVLEGDSLPYEGEDTPGYDNYQHIGWSTQPNATVISDLFAVPRDANSKVDVYPVFTKEAIDYAISYQRMENAELEGDTRVSYTVEMATFTLPAAHRIGDEFLGWYLDEDCEGERVVRVVAGSTGNLTLYAKWASDDIPETVTRLISYNNLNGGVMPADAPYSYVEGEAVSLPTPTLSGYKFGGWYASSAFTGKAVNSTDGKTGDLVLWAKWTLSDAAGSDDGNGGSGSGSGTAGGNSGNGNGSGGSAGGSGSTAGENGGNAGSSGNGNGSSGNGGNSGQNPYGSYNVQTVGSGGNGSGANGNAGDASAEGAEGQGEANADGTTADGEINDEADDVALLSEDGANPDDGTSPVQAKGVAVGEEGSADLPAWAIGLGTAALVAAAVSGGVFAVRRHFRKMQEQYGGSVK